MDWALRDELAARFRRTICERLGVTLFRHQAEWWAATEGWQLTDTPVAGAPTWSVRVGETVSTVWLVPRVGGAAHVVAELAAYKAGKSFGAGLWLAGFAAAPRSRVQIVGMEYDTCAPEFDYLVEALISDRGLNLPYEEYTNRPREGRMILTLRNGARFECRSWERREALKGKAIDAYCFAEAYQFPGIEVFTSLAQNLSPRRGFAIFPTTPDRPWVRVFHERGHGEDPDWHCTCGVPRSVNPWTYQAADEARDRALMPREKFAIAYLGQIGEFAGRVFAYQIGQQVFTPSTHPELWRDPTGPAILDNLAVPDRYTVMGGADTGTFASAVWVAFSPEGEAFVLAEVPNYRYLAGLPELDEQLSVPGWAQQVLALADRVRARPVLWADANSQFKHELQRFGVTLWPSTAGRELRTEVAREYVHARRIWFAPWLRVVTWELEHARWPDDPTASGRFERLKLHDHTLDALEHVLVRRPIGHWRREPTAGSFLEAHYGRGRTAAAWVDPHLGRLAR